MENQISKEELELDQIAQAFAKEAIHKLLSEKSKEQLIDNDLMYKLFGGNRTQFAKVRDAILGELFNFQKLMEAEANLAFEKISVKYSQHRD